MSCDKVLETVATISTMNQKLDEYRKERRRKEFFKLLTRTISKIIENSITYIKETVYNPFDHMEEQVISPDVPLLPSDQENKQTKTKLPNPEPDDSELQIESVSKKSLTKIGIIVLLWILLYVYFIKIEFGAVFFCVSLLSFIYFNTRTGKKRSDEISAYSVFNEGCTPIDGTIDPQQFEKEIRGGFF